MVPAPDLTRLAPVDHQTSGYWSAKLALTCKSMSAAPLATLKVWLAPASVRRTSAPEMVLVLSPEELKPSEPSPFHCQLPEIVPPLFRATVV